MKRCASIVVSDIDFDVVAREHELDNANITPAASHVNERFSKLVAGVHGLASLMQLLEFIQVRCSNGRNHMNVVTSELLFCGFRKGV